MSVPAEVIPERPALAVRETLFEIVLALVEPSVPPASVTPPVEAPRAELELALSVPALIVVPPV